MKSLSNFVIVQPPQIKACRPCRVCRHSQIKGPNGSKSLSNLHQSDLHFIFSIFRLWPHLQAYQTTPLFTAQRGNFASVARLLRFLSFRLCLFCIHHAQKPTIDFLVPPELSDVLFNSNAAHQIQPLTNNKRIRKRQRSSSVRPDLAL